MSRMLPRNSFSEFLITCSTARVRYVAFLVHLYVQLHTPILNGHHLYFRVRVTTMIIFQIHVQTVCTRGVQTYIGESRHNHLIIVSLPL
jgi:hypothetical protein